jgi:hypothetical protein
MCDKLVRAVSCAVLATCFASGQPSRKYVPPDFDKKMAALKDFESGVAPLFVLGDLNEDGVVDDKDAQLVASYVDKHVSRGISCVAAGDVNVDGMVDARDVALIQQALRRGPVESPPLSYHSSLPCDYAHFFIAAGPGAKPGGSVAVHFLNPAFNTQNSKISVQSGEATVARTANAFHARVAKTAQPNSLVTLAIALADGKRYVYSFWVHDTASR